MDTILEQIYTPKDLKRLSEKELRTLTGELRELIVETLSKTGGHLASNLGVVELTLALHTIFDAPRDKILWDVSHQTYTHKILTERREQFHTIRQEKGLSGFCKRSESYYDAFGAGHSSTSISAALGIAEARDLQGKHFHVLSVIGDGALGAGLALEGLNNAGSKRRKFIIVLNDNEMSISKNVGALAAHLNHLITGRFYNKLKGDAEALMKSIPVVGETLFKFSKRIDETMKGFVTPGMLFEQLGFKYVGPVDGHNLHELLDTFRNVRDYIERPTLVHVVTQKGKGYQQAEENAATYHSAAPFCSSNGQFVKQEPFLPTYTQIFGECLLRLAGHDEKIVAISAAMCAGTGLDGFANKFPERFYDVGIAEQHAVTFAAGLTTEGFKPVVAIYSTFLQRAYDQVLHDVCLQNLPVTFALDRAGLVGADGPTHHGVFDFAYLRHLPNMLLMAPKDENELQHMLKTALDHPGPAAIRYPKGNGQGVPLDTLAKPLEIGKAEIVKAGSDVLILAAGAMVAPALEAAHNLREDEHIDAAVVNVRFIKPLDAELILEMVERCGNKVLTAEEHVLQGGFGSAVLELLQEHYADHYLLRRLGVPDKYIEHASQSRLRHKYGLDAEGIEKAIRRLI